MIEDSGRVPSAPGSREPSPSVSAASGFDPSRDAEAALVAGFAEALLAKLRAAEAKYGWQRAWMRPDWADDLRAHLREHVDKGDPIDVAAYCAFAWHHGWSTRSS